MTYRVQDILIIGGSAEAHQLARGLPQAQAVLPAPLRNDPGDVTYEIVPRWQAADLARLGTGPVVLASHPCDGALFDTLPDRCAAQGRPLLLLQRPPWSPTSQDKWVMLNSDREAGRVIPEKARVFVGLGRSVKALEEGLAGRYLVIRQLGARGEVFEGAGHYLDGEAPFGIAEEIATLRAEQIDWLLVRNAGGRGAWPKLAAARALGLPVAMLPRPQPPAADAVFADADAARQWLERRIAPAREGSHATDHQ